MSDQKNAEQVGIERDELGFWKIGQLYRVNPPFNGFSDVPWLNDDQKAIGEKLLQALKVQPKHKSGVGTGEIPAMDRIQPITSLNCLLCDPESFNVFFEFYNNIVYLTTGLEDHDEILRAGTHKKGIDMTVKGKDPDVRRRLQNALLMCLALAGERNDPFWLRTMAITPIFQEEPSETGDDYFISGEKAIMIKHPLSSVWTDEESLCLQFTYAIMRDEMTDELWERCMATWSLPETIRYLFWVGMYNFCLMFQTTFFRRKTW
ncbi:MAG: hypothetical protein KJP07_20780 [Desulfatitalea sp.]|nr:hypothetical protein [Desulfatitalea sp.]